MASVAHVELTIRSAGWREVYKTEEKFPSRKAPNAADLLIARAAGHWHAKRMSSVITAPTYRWSVEEYQKLGEVGIFHEDDRVELLNGEIVIMAPIGLRHMNAVRRLINTMARKYGSRCLVDAQNPLVIDGESMPQPDLLLLRQDLDEGREPTPEDVLLLVEVADSSLSYDSRDKRDAYARTGVREYWLLNLPQNQLHVFRDPDSHGYRSEVIIRADESVAPLAFPQETVALAEILPP
jgi:Uma2 family endonuclease